MNIEQFTKTIAETPALQVKHALIEYFGEATHQGFEGWNANQVETLIAFMKDFATALSNMPTPTNTYAIWGVEIDNTK